MNDKKADAHEEGVNNGTNSNLFIQLAEAHRLQGRYDEAIHICREGLQKAPESLRGRLILGKCYFEKGMNAEAKRELEKVAERIEECLPVFKLLGQIYLQEKSGDPALYDAREEEKPKKGLSLPEMNLLRQKSERKSIPVEADTQEDFAAPKRTLPGDPTPKVIQTDTLAEIYLKQGHLEKALSIYQEILTLEPGNTEVQGKYEILQRRLESQRKAASYRKVISKMERWLIAVAPPGTSSSL